MAKGEIYPWMVLVLLVGRLCSSSMIAGRCGSPPRLFFGVRPLAGTVARPPRARPCALLKMRTEFFEGLDMIPIPRFDRPRHAEQEEVDVVFAKFSRPVGR